MDEGRQQGIPVPGAGAIPARIGTGDEPVVSLGQAVAENVRRLRSERGVTQAELARMVSTLGASWTKARIFSLESGGKSARDSVTLGELIQLAIALRRPVDDLVAGAGFVRLTDRCAIPRDTLVQDIRAGRPPSWHLDAPELEDPAAAEIAQRLGEDVRSVAATARRLYGDTATEERRQRVGTDQENAYRQRNFTQQIEQEIREDMGR